MVLVLRRPSCHLRHPPSSSTTVSHSLLGLASPPPPPPSASISGKKRSSTYSTHHTVCNQCTPPPPRTSPYYHLHTHTRSPSSLPILTPFPPPQSTHALIADQHRLLSENHTRHPGTPLPPHPPLSANSARPQHVLPTGIIPSTPYHISQNHKDSWPFRSSHIRLSFPPLTPTLSKRGKNDTQTRVLLTLSEFCHASLSRIQLNTSAGHTSNTLVPSCSKAWHISCPFDSRNLNPAPLRSRRTHLGQKEKYRARTPTTEGRSG